MKSMFRHLARGVLVLLGLAAVFVPFLFGIWKASGDRGVISAIKPSLQPYFAFDKA